MSKIEARSKTGLRNSDCTAMSFRFRTARRLLLYINEHIVRVMVGLKFAFLLFLACGLSSYAGEHPLTKYESIDGKGYFDLVVTLDWNPNPDERDELKASFEDFAKTVYIMSEGKHQIRKLRTFEANAHWDTADIRVIRCNDSIIISDPFIPKCERAHSNRNGFYYAGARIFSWFSPTLSPGDMTGTTPAVTLFGATLAHEFAHYAYGLADEYEETSSWKCWTDLYNPYHPRCDDHGTGRIMDSQAWSAQFSIASDYATDWDKRTAQWRVHRASAWETLIFHPLGDFVKESFFVGRPRWRWPEFAAMPVAPTALSNAATLAQQWDPLSLSVSFGDQGNVTVLVIDRSGSMARETPTKISAAKNAAKQYVDLMATGDTVAVVAFESTAQTVAEPSVLTNQAVKEAIKAAIDGITTTGGTNFAAGMDKAWQVLSAPAYASSHRNVVFLSDGQPTQQAVLTNFVSNSIRVDTLGLGTGVDETILRGMALATGGTYLPSPSSSQLAELFVQVNRVVSGSASIINSSAQAVPGSQKFEVSAIISSQESEATFRANWGPGDAIHLELVDPQGNVIRADSQVQGVVYSSGDTYAMFTISAPVAGEWTSRATNMGTATSQSVVLEASGRSLLGLNLSVADVVYPQPVAVAATLSSTQPVAGATVTATVTQWGSAGGTSTEKIVQLRDDGVAPDDVANDGTYSGVLLDYLPQSSYSVKVAATNPSGTAYATSEGMTHQSGTGNGTVQALPAFQRVTSRTFSTSGTVALPVSSASAVLVPTDNTRTWGTIKEGATVAWYKFIASAGVKYYIQTGDLIGAGSVVPRTRLTLLGTDATSAIATSVLHAGTAISYLEWSAPASGTYFAKVEFTDGGTGSFALTVGERSVYRDETPPSAPVVTAIPVGTNVVDLTWTAGADNVGVTYYHIFRNGTLAKTLDASTSSYSDTGLLASTVYEYSVLGCDAAGNCSNQNVKVTAITDSAASALNSLNISSTGSGRVSTNIAPGVDLCNGWVLSGSESGYVSCQSAIVKDGPAAIEVSRDNYSYHALPTLIKGMVEVELWMKPYPTATSANVGFDVGNSLVNREAIRVLVNDQNGWYASNGASRPLFHQITSRTWTRVRLLINTATSTYSLWLDGVSYFTDVPAGANISDGIDSISLVSGRGTTGQPSQFEVLRLGNAVMDCGTPCSIPYAAGAQVTLTAVPAANGSFGGWSGACSGSGSCTITMDSAKNVTATFGPITAGATQPGPPYNVAATAGNANATVSFSAPLSDGGSPVTGYIVTSSPGGTTATGIASPITVTGLTNAATYTFTVVATNAVGASGPSTQTNPVTPSSPGSGAPSTPTGLIATAVSSTQINLSWTLASGYAAVTNYKVFRGGIQIAVVNSAASYSNTGLSPATSYTYAVQACDAAGNCSNQSNQVSATTLPASGGSDTAPPTTPIALAAIPTGTTINLSWTPSSDNIGVTQYRIFRNGGLMQFVNGAPPATGFLDPSLSASTTYTYTVQACDAAGNCSAQSAPASATTSGGGGTVDTQAPTMPTGVIAAAVTSSQISLSWAHATDNVGVTNYKIYRNGALVMTAPSTVNVFGDTALAASTTYTYRVQACDAEGNCSAQSNAASATTMPASQTPTSTTVGTTTSTGATTTTTGATTTTTVGSTTTTVSSTTSTTLAGGGLSLVPGWNLVGNSWSGAINVASVFGDTAKVTTVWKWLPGSVWAFYAPSIADGGQNYAAGKGYAFLTTINGGEGFWVNANTAFTAPVPAGSAILASAFQNAPSGWSLIAVGDNPTPGAFNSALSITPPSPGTIPFNLTTLWAWDSGLANWYFWAPSLANQGGTVLIGYIASKGYLDFGTKTVAPGAGFWINRP